MGNNKSKAKKTEQNIEQIIQIDNDIPNTSKSVCKIKIESQLDFKFYIGFLIKFPIDQDTFYCLISNSDYINNDLLRNKSNIYIYIYYKNFLKETKINLDKNKRYIKTFTDIGLNITAIEILEEDNIPKNYFLYPELEIRINNKLINDKIYIPKLTDEKGVVIIEGFIKEINKNGFRHTLIDDYPGFPIIIETFNNILGIAKKNNKKENNADFIYPAIKIIEEDIRKKKNNGKYIKGKYIWEDGKYYKGKFKNNLPNGKGIKYYPNGSILYEGDFINGKFEGKGKYIYDDGDYFIGQYKNGLRNGKGTIYYKNGIIMFEGEYINDKKEGNGKYIWEDGEYYVGQFKNNLPNGKGISYYSNNKIKYEGDYINGKFDGNGKYFWEDGKYYIGQEKNGFAHGKGIYYYSNGDIMYEGDCVNNNFEGNGKYIWEDGTYYIGQWKNSQRNGKGILYYQDGKINYDGDWVNGRMNGYGKYIYDDDSYYIGQWKNDLKHGKGTMYDSNGNIQKKGKWVDDLFIAY